MVTSLQPASALILRTCLQCTGGQPRILMGSPDCTMVISPCHLFSEPVSSVRGGQPSAGAVYLYREPETSSREYMLERRTSGHYSGLTFRKCRRHTGEFPMGVGHRVENGWGLTKVAVVLLNGLLW